MLSRLRTTKEKRHSNVAHTRFRFSEDSTVADIPVTHENFGRPTYKGDSWTIQKFDMDYGIGEDPVDANINFSLYVAAPGSPPDFDDENGSNFLWQATQFYRVLSAVGVIETTDTLNLELDEEIAWENDGEQAGDILLGLAGSAVLLCFGAGFISIKKSLLQTQLKDDFSEYEMDFQFEEALDEEEGEQNDVPT